MDVSQIQQPLPAWAEERRHRFIEQLVELDRLHMIAREPYMKALAELEVYRPLPIVPW